MTEADEINKKIDSILKGLSDTEKERMKSMLGVISANNDAAYSASRMSNVFKSTTSTVGGAVGQLSSFIKQVQTEAIEPFSVGAQALDTAMGIGKEALTGFGDMIGGLGPILGKRLETVLGPISKLAGGLIAFAGDTGIGAVREAFAILVQNLQMTRDAFMNLAQQGVILGTGLTGIGDLSKQAGVPIKAFTQGLIRARQDLSKMGIGAGDAAERVAGVMNQVTANGGELYQQLSALGYSTEQQVELAAMQLANDRAAGITKRRSDAELAKDTAELGKNMKILQDITGKDAKAAMEQARMQAMEADLLAKAEAEGGAEGRAKLAAQLTAMPEEMKKGYLEFVSTGGQAIADAATNVAIQQNPQLMEFYKQQYSILGQGNVNAKEATTLATKGLEDVAKAAKENIGAAAQIGMGARLTGDALLAGASSINNAIIRMGTVLGEGATEAAKKRAEAEAQRKDPLLKVTEQLAQAGLEITNEVQQMLRKPNQVVADSINDFTQVLKEGTKKLNEFVDDLIKKYKDFNKEVASTPTIPGATSNRELNKKPTIPGATSNREIATQPTPTIPGATSNREIATQPTPTIPGATSNRELRIPGRAAGGPINPSGTYLVGELGPELVVPKSKATVLPNEILKGLEEFKSMSSKDKDLETALKNNQNITKQFEQSVNQLLSQKSGDTNQIEMLSLLRQLVMTNSEVKAASSEMVAIMEDILSVQSRMANA